MELALLSGFHTLKGPSSMQGNYPLAGWQNIHLMTCSQDVLPLVAGRPSPSHAQLCIDTMESNPVWDDTDEYGGFGPPDDYVGPDDDYPGPNDGNNSGYTYSVSEEVYYKTL